jgi:predicted transposase YbfD/YdcC|tara:strand:- start:23 stop:1144 length:1122 start_codon:yes stop_codon:yes gene_type:complete
MTSPFIEHFSNLSDPRVTGRTDYPLLEIVFLCISAVVSGFDGWESIEDFGHSKLEWLRQFLDYKNGIPKHDTIARVISCLSATGLQRCFIDWVQDIAKITDGEVIAIDGKTARRSHDKKSRKAAIHMVSAWACQNGVVLGQHKTEDKSNEITAIPKLLNLLEIKGCIITIDAMGTQKEIAKLIQEKDADYVLALKGNQGTLCEMTTDYFETSFKNDFKNIEYDFHEDIEKGHGRIETRKYFSVPLPNYLKGFSKDWKGLKSLICVHSKREIKDEIQEEKRFYISSLKSNAKKIGNAIRKHWSIESSLHWVLDVTFGEDDSRIRRGMAAENMVVMRHVALNLLKKETSNDYYMPRKRRKALLDDDYRRKVLIQK